MMEDRFWNLDSMTLLCCYFSSFPSACEWEQDLDQAWSMVKSPLCWFSIKQHHSTANFELRNKRCHCHCSLDLICFSPQSNLLCFLWNRVCSKSPDQLNTRERRRIINPDDQHHNVIDNADRGKLKLKFSVKASTRSMISTWLLCHCLRRRRSLRAVNAATR